MLNRIASLERELLTPAKKCRGDSQVTRGVAVDQVQPLGELRLATTDLASRAVSSFSEQIV